MLNNRITVNRQFSMPNRWTFQIPPIAEILSKYVGDGKGWIDPFSGQNSPAEITNDLDPGKKADYHMKAIEFLKVLDGPFKGVLFDPPYSLRQVKECYKSVGIEFNTYDQHYVNRWTFEKAELSRLIEIGGYAICFGWNTSGIGKINGFEIKEILIVNHGAAHNDTMVTIERKIQVGF